MTESFPFECKQKLPQKKIPLHSEVHSFTGTIEKQIFEWRETLIHAVDITANHLFYSDLWPLLFVKHFETDLFVDRINLILNILLTSTTFDKRVRKCWVSRLCVVHFLVTLTTSWGNAGHTWVTLNVKCMFFFLSAFALAQFCVYFTHRCNKSSCLSVVSVLCLQTAVGLWPPVSQLLVAPIYYSVSGHR